LTFDIRPGAACAGPFFARQFCLFAIITVGKDSEVHAARRRRDNQGGGRDCLGAPAAMSRLSKIILIAVGTLAGIVVGIATTVALLLRVNARSQVATRA
jgi:hypothetical protein